MTLRETAGEALYSGDSHGCERVKWMERRAVRRNRSLLRLHAEMGPHFLERGFRAPTRDETAEDGGGLRIEIGAEKRGWLTLTGWVTDQNPADRGLLGIDVP